DPGLPQHLRAGQSRRHGQHQAATRLPNAPALIQQRQAGPSASVCSARKAGAMELGTERGKLGTESSSELDAAVREGYELEVAAWSRDSRVAPKAARRGSHDSNARGALPNIRA